MHGHRDGFEIDRRAIAEELEVTAFGVARIFAGVDLEHRGGVGEDVDHGENRGGDAAAGQRRCVDDHPDLRVDVVVRIDRDEVETQRGAQPGGNPCVLGALAVARFDVGRAVAVGIDETDALRRQRRREQREGEQRREQPREVPGAESW
ncbi:MAG: hypothetical protein HC897_11945 [Thermoanaerobaculia bacterium]|nr:hypothetical protein [Thermoanaerobaculia bacterium]